MYLLGGGALRAYLVEPDGTSLTRVSGRRSKLLCAFGNAQVDCQASGEPPVSVRVGVAWGAISTRRQFPGAESIDKEAPETCVSVRGGVRGDVTSPRRFQLV